MFIILEVKRVVKCCLNDGSILKEYTSMLFDPERPTGIPAHVWQVIRPNSPNGNYITDIAVTSDHKWLFAACPKGWWAMFDLEQDKCVIRQQCTLDQDGCASIPRSVAVSSDDKLFYMGSENGIVESYDIQAAKIREVITIPNQDILKIAVDTNNQFLFIASQSGNLYKYDTG